jgi:hypothetical protein
VFTTSAGTLFPPVKYIILKIHYKYIFILNEEKFVNGQIFEILCLDKRLSDLDICDTNVLVAGDKGFEPHSINQSIMRLVSSFGIKLVYNFLQPFFPEYFAGM